MALVMPTILPYHRAVVMVAELFLYKRKQLYRMALAFPQTVLQAAILMAMVLRAVEVVAQSYYRLPTTQIMYQ